MIGILNTLGDLLGLVSVESDFLANGATLLVLHHSDAEARIYDTITAKNLAQILRLVFDTTGWFAVQWHVVILVRQLRFSARQFNSLCLFRRKKGEIIN